MGRWELDVGRYSLCCFKVFLLEFDLVENWWALSMSAFFLVALVVVVLFFAVFLVPIVTFPSFAFFYSGARTSAGLGGGWVGFPRLLLLYC